MTLYFIKESESLAKMTKDTAIPLHEHKQQLFGLPKTQTHTQVAKIHSIIIKFHEDYFIESITYEDVNHDQIIQSNFKFRNIFNKESKLTRFQIYPETELACKYNKPLYKTQYSEVLVENEQGFNMNTGK